MFSTLFELSCILTWQFQPSTFAFEYMTTHFLYEDRVWVATLYVCAVEDLCLSSYYLMLTWQLQHFVSSALWSVHFSNEANVFSCHIYCWTIIGGVGVHTILPKLFATFNWSPCGKYILLGGNCLLHTFIFTRTFCFVLTSAEWLAAIIKTTMMISWSYRGRIAQLDGQQTAMR